MVEARLTETPAYGLYGLIARQLEDALAVLNEGRTPTDAEKKRITMGALAARELETTDPELADLVMKADFLYKQLVP
jgi:hypothetical protein